MYNKYMTHCNNCGHTNIFIDENAGLKFHNANNINGILHCEGCCIKYTTCDDSNYIIDMIRYLKKHKRKTKLYEVVLHRTPQMNIDRGKMTIILSEMDDKSGKLLMELLH